MVKIHDCAEHQVLELWRRGRESCYLTLLKIARFSSSYTSFPSNQLAGNSDSLTTDRDSVDVGFGVVRDVGRGVSFLKYLNDTIPPRRMAASALSSAMGRESLVVMTLYPRGLLATADNRHSNKQPKIPHRRGSLLYHLFIHKSFPTRPGDSSGSS